MNTNSSFSNINDVEYHRLGGIVNAPSSLGPPHRHSAQPPTLPAPSSLGPLQHHSVQPSTLPAPSSLGPPQHHSVQPSTLPVVTSPNVVQGSNYMGQYWRELRPSSGPISQVG